MASRKENTPHPSSVDQCHERITELEQELAQLRAAKNPAASADDFKRSGEKMPREVLWEQWLIDTIQALFEHSSETAIEETLQRFNQLIGLNGACFYLMAPDGNPIHRHCHWLQTANNPLAPWQYLTETQCKQWLSKLNTTAVAVIDIQQQLEQLPSHLIEAFNKSQTTHIATIPIQRRTNVDGFLCLYKNQPRHHNGAAWSPRELDMALAIGEVIDMSIESRAVTSQLAERDTRFQYAMEASRDGLWDWDLATNNIYFSHSFLRMLGYENSPVEMNLNTLKNIFIHPDDVDHVINRYNAAISDQSAYLDFEYRMKHKCGDELWVYSRTKFVEQNTSGHATRVVGINANITHFKTSQEELLNAKAQADSANRTKSEFLNRMSHEIRTPMNAIIGMGHLLHDTSLNRQQNDYLGSINQAAHSLLHIIDKVLDFAKIDSDKIVLDNSHFDLDEVLQSLSQMTDADAELKALEVVFDTAPNVSRFLRGDAVRLNQVLYHLIHNAIKFSTSGEVLVTTRQADIHKDYVEITFCVEDQGIGIPQIEIDNLFEPFAQVDCSSSRRFGGTGLGLSICRHLINLMQGSINIETEPHKGTAVTFTARFQHSHMGATTMRTQPLQFEGIRTLIVDDNDIAQEVINRTAASLHLTSECVSCAAEAIDKIIAADAGSNPYQLVLMDWRMPGINGLEASKLIKQSGKITQPPAIVMVSAYRQEEMYCDSKNSPIDGFIHKPITQSQLFNMLVDVFPELPAPTVPQLPRNTEQAIDPSAVDNLLYGRHLLLAEDNIVNQKVAVGILKKKHVRVTIAANGREAVELMMHHHGQFDAILMDLEMPDMDGLQATRAIRQGRYAPQIPIVALTAQALSGDKERCLDAGMNGYIAKPVNPQKLYDTLAQLLQEESV